MLKAVLQADFCSVKNYVTFFMTNKNDPNTSGILLITQH